MWDSIARAPKFLRAQSTLSALNVGVPKSPLTALMSECLVYPGALEVLFKCPSSSLGVRSCSLSFFPVKKRFATLLEMESLIVVKSFKNFGCFLLS